MTVNQISRARHYSTLNITETIQDKHVVRPLTENDRLCGLLNCAIADDLDQPSMSFQQFCLKISVAYFSGLQ